MAVNRNNPTILTNPGGIDGTTYTNQTAENLSALWDSTAGSCVVDGGLGDANEVHLIPAHGNGMTSYREPMVGFFTPLSVNTAAVQINLNGLGLRDLVRPNGDNLVAGDLDIRQHHFMFNETLNKAVLMSYQQQISIPNTGSLTEVIHLDRSVQTLASGTSVLLTLPIQGSAGDILTLPYWTVEGNDTGSKSTTWSIQLYVDNVLEQTFPNLVITSTAPPTTIDMTIDDLLLDEFTYILPDNVSHTLEWRATRVSIANGGALSVFRNIGIGKLQSVTRTYF